MQEKEKILLKRIDVLKKHQKALAEYKQLIDEFEGASGRQSYAPYTPLGYQQLTVQQKALFDAYLKRFASLQDYMGTKVFPLIMNMAGITSPEK